jgi:fluoroacetyl-CoA thioesterase
MRPIQPGTRGTFTMQVQARHLANQFKDAILPEVFATPMMVLAIENAALNAIKPYLEPGESAVGTEVNIKHLAATPIGHRVEAVAVVTKVEGRHIEFSVSAHDETEEIGRGTHGRTVVDMTRLKNNLAKKAKPE